MMTVAQIVSAFREIIGWPYASPGSNNQQGIDCSGAFVYAYRKYGYSIYHGSNRIIRVYCNGPFRVSGAGQLKEGMAIFKSRTDTSNMSVDYKPGGKYYNPALPEDFYHIGLVASLSPLQIINATTPVARIDTKLSLWSHAAYLNAVNYQATPAPTPTPTPTPVPQTAVTTAPSGGTANLRKEPAKSSSVLIRIPLGQTVAVLAAVDDTWWKVSYQSYTGYMMQEFLKEAPTPTPTPVPQTAVTTAPSGSTVNLRKEPAKNGIVLIRVPLGQTVTVLAAVDDTWWKVRYQSYTGYMMQEFLKAV